MNNNVTVNANGTISFRFDGIETLFIPTHGLTGWNRDNHTAYGNVTLFLDPNNLCNVNICDLSLAHFDYVPNLAGNALFAAIFGIYIIINLFFGIRHRTWGYMVAMVLGLIGEVIGYIARILLHNNPFDPTGNNFIIYLVCLTLAPALFSAAIYLCLGRIVVVYGENLSRFQPRTYTLIFCGFDLFSLVLQGTGGGIASTANTNSTVQSGINIMLAGLCFQVASLAFFAILCADFAYRLYKNPQDWSEQYVQLYRSKRFSAFICGLCLATFTIFVRSVFRVAELSGGFRGPLANNQISFMILEGVMVIIATTCLTLLHPGVSFQGAWSAANFSLRGRKKGNETKPMVLEDIRQPAAPLEHQY
jgi:hypothetical protein